ncbi:MAG: DNA repair protein RecN [Christensenellaceae bacterium]|nr:DNA repair protein RecN [Christensenellaceae bacterium]
MLTQLLIRNLAIIEELELPFYGGLTVLSGETGAGKSIVVDAVSLVLGARADKSLIRSGEDKAYVEAMFSIEQNAAVKQLMFEQGFENDEIIVLSREIYQSGRSVCRINGTMVTLQALKDIASNLMEIHGQHEHQALMAEANHIKFLDAMGEAAHQELLLSVSELSEECNNKRKELQKLVDAQSFRAERLEILTKQKAEIENAKLRIGEEEELSRIKETLKNKDKIIRLLNMANEILFSSDSAAVPAFFDAMQALYSISALDNKFEELYKRMNSLYYEAEDLQYTINEMQNAVSTEDMSLEEVETRLDAIRRLEFKYGISIEEVLNKLESIKEEINIYSSLDEEIETLQIELNKKEKQYFEAAQKLSNSRIELAETVRNRIEDELFQLNMKAAKFFIDINTDKSKISAQGFDSVSFKIAPNIGEEAKHLSKTASGGELSRIMLAIKASAADKNMISGMVFDEIDTGISGETARVVAEKMWDIAAYRQVIAVTHLQQIATMASKQIIVKKLEESGRTLTTAHYMTYDERINEIARMLGETKTESGSAKAHAKLMLDEASEYRKKHAKKFD